MQEDGPLYVHVCKGQPCPPDTPALARMQGDGDSTLPAAEGAVQWISSWQLWEPPLAAAAADSSAAAASATAATGGSSKRKGKASGLDSPAASLDGVPVDDAGWVPHGFNPLTPLKP